MPLALFCRTLLETPPDAAVVKRLHEEKQVKQKINQPAAAGNPESGMMIRTPHSIRRISTQNQQQCAPGSVYIFTCTNIDVLARQMRASGVQLETADDKGASTGLLMHDWSAGTRASVSCLPQWEIVVTDFRFGCSNTPNSQRRRCLFEVVPMPRDGQHPSSTS